MLCIKHLNGRKCAHGSFRHVVTLSLRYVCFLIHVANQFSCLYRSFIMTKRDSQIAQLPSPRTLNMESHDIDMPIAGPHSYAAPATPGPDSHPQAASTLHHRFLPYNSQMVHARLVHDKKWDIPSCSRSWNALYQRGEFIVKFLWKKRMHMDILTTRLWSSSSMALLDTSVTAGEAHWTMIVCALSSPITGDLDLRRSARSLNMTILNPGRIRNKHQPPPYLPHLSPLRPRSHRSRSKSCRWPGS